MGMLEKIEYLMQIKNISNKKILADVSGLPYTTVAGLWVKPIDNTKRSTLFALAKALGCSVDYLGNDEIPLEAHEEEPKQTYYLDPEVAELADQPDRGGEGDDADEEQGDGPRHPARHPVVVRDERGGGCVRRPRRAHGVPLGHRGTR